LFADDLEAWHSENTYERKERNVQQFATDCVQLRWSQNGTTLNLGKSNFKSSERDSVATDFSYMQEYVRFEILSAVVMNVAIFWNISPHIPYTDRRFGGMYHLKCRNRHADLLCA
jgi:hypothetical protein